MLPEERIAEDKADQDIIKEEDVPSPSEKDSGEHSYILKLCGISRGQVNNQIGDLLNGDNPKIDISDSHGEIYIRIIAKRTEEKSAKKLAKPVAKEIRSRFAEKIFAMDEESTLEESVVDLLKNNGLTVTTAESCTGGMIAARLVDVPGVSEVFKEGFITYSNKAKRLRLGVKKTTLLAKGAVSEQTVKEMLKGGIKISRADVCLAVSGIAGPDGGTEEKPVGTVFIGCFVGGKAYINEHHFDGDRREIREKTVTEALALLRLCLLKYYSEKNFS
ncbi:MAG: nicotinamide-nucleotide amidohydrolase family protein [Lachnospiraceae bacterium]|nr:nicotinamide-nucleotide amidohydrolase family protein [Lachnospiraceae bacterium]